MKTFTYHHNTTLSQEFVNGSYELGGVQYINFNGHDIIYRVGSALLDNSCCGNYGCGYGLVIGEVINSSRDGATIISIVREMDVDDPIAVLLRETLMKQEALGVVNFYTSTEDQRRNA